MFQELTLGGRTMLNFGLQSEHRDNISYAQLNSVRDRFEQLIVDLVAGDQVSYLLDFREPLNPPRLVASSFACESETHRLRGQPRNGKWTIHNKPLRR